MCAGRSEEMGSALSRFLTEAVAMCREGYVKYFNRLSLESLYLRLGRGGGACRHIDIDDVGMRPRRRCGMP